MSPGIADTRRELLVSFERGAADLDLILELEIGTKGKV
jgi:hypothetical protein